MLFKTVLSVAWPFKNIEYYRSYYQTCRMLLDGDKKETAMIWFIIYFHIYKYAKFVALRLMPDLSEVDRIAMVDYYHFIFDQKGLRFIGVAAHGFYLETAYFFYVHYLTVKRDYFRFANRFLVNLPANSHFIGQYKGQNARQLIIRIGVMQLRFFQIFAIFAGLI